MTKDEQVVQERQTRLLGMVNRQKRVAVQALAEALAVSGATIRKDLRDMEERGLLGREHGFAVVAESDDVGERMAVNQEAKRQIARLAAGCVDDGETVMIESGSCNALLAEELAASRRDVTIITNSAYIASFIRRQPGAHVILLGGEYQNEAQVMVGPMVRLCARDFYVRKIFVGTDGFSGRGFMANDLMRAEAVRDMAANAREVVVLTEAAKFSQTGVVPLLPLERVSAVYTGGPVPAAALRLLTEHGVRVFQASEERPDAPVEERLPELP